MPDDRIAARRPDGAAAAADERPATFRDVFGVREFRALYLACSISWLGDYLARAAITVLVYQQTRSVLLSAVSFAVSYLPWIVGGPLLAAVAERYPYRRVMVVCDVARMVLIALVAIPGVPVAAMIALLFLATLFNPPTDAARSALMPLILSRDRLVVGLAVTASTSQAAQVTGYLAGATLAVAVNPRLAIAFDALTFAVSAVLILLGIRSRPPAVTPAHRRHLLRETGDGFRLVFGSRVLRSIAVLVFTITLFAIVPEGLAAAWAQQSTPDDGHRGLAQGLIMAATPVGFILGGVLIGRFVAPNRRRRLIRPFAVTAPLALVPALTAPSAPVVALMAMISGFAVAGLMPTLNGMFVLALPHGFRARAFGVMQGGLQISQGSAVLATGLLAERFALPTVVGAWSVGGTLLMLLVTSRWPTSAAFDEANTDAMNAVAATDPATAAGTRTADQAGTRTAEPAGTRTAEPAGTRTAQPAGTPAESARTPTDPVGTPAEREATRVTPGGRYDVLSPPPAAGRMDR